MSQREDLGIVKSGNFEIEHSCNLDPKSKISDWTRQGQTSSHRIIHIEISDFGSKLQEWRFRNCPISQFARHLYGLTYIRSHSQFTDSVLEDGY